jgi:hypothetical protein
MECSTATQPLKPLTFAGLDHHPRSVATLLPPALPTTRRSWRRTSPLCKLLSLICSFMLMEVTL